MAARDQGVVAGLGEEGESGAPTGRWGLGLERAGAAVGALVPSPESRRCREVGLGLLLAVLAVLRGMFLLTRAIPRSA